MTEAEERAFIAEAATPCAAATGEAPLGWCGQDFNESARTPALLAEAGFAYTTDWPNDDRPYLLGPYDGRRLAGAAAAAGMERPRVHVAAPRERLRSGPTASPRRSPSCTRKAAASFNLTLHPWIAGQAHRIRWLREALSRVLGQPQVWRTTTDEVARVARGQLGG